MKNLLTVLMTALAAITLASASHAKASHAKASHQVKADCCCCCGPTAAKHVSQPGHAAQTMAKHAMAKAADGDCPICGQNCGM